MGKIMLVTGGRRSGKSIYAQRLAESLPSPRLYVATCPILDEETKIRIDAHRRSRAGKQWDTIEEQTDLRSVLSGSKNYKTALVECIAVWISNLMFVADKTGEKLTETKAQTLIHEVLKAIRQTELSVIFVTNEVGWDVVSANPMARLFSDIAGRVNQAIAEEADEVILAVCGQTLKIK